jgi:signal peptidase I
VAPRAETPEQPAARPGRGEVLLHYLSFGLAGRKPVPAEGAAPTHTSRMDGTREVVETVVFVVVLVLLLKSFVAEAFVIPTGSMAETLWGYQKIMTCPQCGYVFPVNCSSEVDPQDGPKTMVHSCICPNCRYAIGDMVKQVEVEETDPRTRERRIAVKEIPKYESHTGDRVLVAKFLYDLPWKEPQRLDVVVFKFPERPQKDYVPMNYIKRLIGEGGETIAIYYGNLYVLAPGKITYNDSNVPPKDLWKKEYMHQDDEKAVKLFDRARGGAFEIIRKPPGKILSMRRIVYDNDHPAADLKHQPPRWAGQEGGAWAEVSAPRGFKCDPGKQAGLDWLRYHHVLRTNDFKPSLITDFMGYNTWNQGSAGSQAEHWVGDLILECEAKVEKAEGVLVFELSRGTDRFRASWDLASGECVLRQVKNHRGKAPPDEKAGEELAKKGTALSKPGSYRLRFANVDDRLVVWVNNDLVFDNDGNGGVTYTPSDHPGPYENDLEPASIGVRGATLSVQQLKLWRDTYYTPPPRGDPSDDPTRVNNRSDVNPSDPDTWSELRKFEPNTFYVQPGHYLCLGDNSPQSSDGRSWGTVPERLMLGRALVVYYPFKFPWWPFDAPVNRVGAIK